MRTSRRLPMSNSSPSLISRDEQYSLYENDSKTDYVSCNDSKKAISILHQLVVPGAKFGCLTCIISPDSFTDDIKKLHNIVMQSQKPLRGLKTLELAYVGSMVYFTVGSAESDATSPNSAILAIFDALAAYSGRTEGEFWEYLIKTFLLSPTSPLTLVVMTTVR